MNTTSENNVMVKDRARNVLIIDDDPVQRKLLKLHLQRSEEYDYDVLECPSASNGKFLARQNHADCILVDYQLPGETGIKFIRSLNQSPDEWSAPPCIMITGHGDESLAVKAMNSGFLDYLPKDKLNTKSLDRSIENAITKHHIQKQLRDQERENRYLLEKLKISNERMRRFVGIVAHDLRNPLGNIISLCDLLPDAESEDERRELEQGISECGERAYGLVNDLLDLSTLEKGKLTMNMRICDIYQIACKVVSDLSVKAARKNIELSISGNENIKAMLDESRIYQVLNNLIGNSIKFTPKGGQVSCDIRVMDMGVRVNVKDSGLGISFERQKDIFLKHEKTNTKGTEGEPGYGFGLPLSQEIVEGHGSKIKLVSEPGLGSSFFFDLPL